MSRTVERLVSMANQIARNLALDPDPAAATAEHIATYWEPRMKAAIAGHVAAGGHGLDPHAAAALGQLATA
jgi:formate dehydrogenase subunit delta